MLSISSLILYTAFLSVRSSHAGIVSTNKRKADDTGSFVAQQKLQSIANRWRMQQDGENNLN